MVEVIKSKFAPTVEEQFQTLMVERNACYVEYQDRELSFFDNEKDAGAWIQHIFGVKPWDARQQGIFIKPLKGREPKPGDAVIYDGSGPFNILNGKDEDPGGIGVLEYLTGSLAICFKASAYRDAEHVSCSGGPLPWIKKESLKLVGLRPTHFWRWGDGWAGANCGGHYTVTVPLWRWDGNSGLEE